jgi:RNA polymerase sigma-70 factor (ECF subfamily)
MSQADSEEQDRLDMGRLAAGQDSALNALMERHAGKLHHYLLRSLQNEAEAADLAQETFVRVYQNRHRFKRDASFSTWLYAIASNLVRDRFRWRQRHRKISLDDTRQPDGGDLHEALPEQGPDPSERLQTEEQAQAVRQAVAGLPEDLRLPLILAEYEGKSQAEIAGILDCTVKAVEMRVYRARKLLRQALAGLLETT